MKFFWFQLPWIIVFGLVEFNVTSFVDTDLLDCYAMPSSNVPFTEAEAQS